MNTTSITRKKILVVDDEPLVCEAVKMMLDFDGHDVVAVGKPKEALALLEQDKFDLVITDYAMPAMKGNELAAAIKARAPGLPVILITAYAEMLKTSETSLEGVDCVISKPFFLEDMREAVKKTTAH